MAERDSVARDSVAPDPSLGEPRWLELEVGEVLVWLHEPPAGVTRGCGVVFCPPFGWDEEKSYRGRRAWADLLAAAGHPTVRFDLPGTGDSAGSPRDPNRLEVWTQTVSAIARWLVQRAGRARVTGLGIGLGGMLAWRAAAGGAPIDDLILWSVPDAGRRLLREIRAAAGLIASAKLDYVRELEGGDLEAVGYRLNAEVVRDLGALRLSELALPDPAGRRVLLLSPGALHVDRPLREHLEASDVQLTVEDGPGFAELMLDPERSELPVATIAKTIAWLAQAPPGPSRPGDVEGGAIERDAIELSVDGVPIRERFVRPLTPRGRLFGIVSEPAGGAARAEIGGLILNTGAIRHTGQNRNGVELARRWAALGLPTVRIDVAGLGDADGDPALVRELAGMYADGRVAETTGLLAELEQEGVPARMIVLGVCAGAYLAMQAAVRCDRVAALVLVNQALIAWDPKVVDEAVTRTALGSLGGRSWRKLLRGDVTLADIRRQLAKLRLDRVLASTWHGADRRQLRAARSLFAQLRDSRVRTVMVFAEHERMRALLSSDARAMHRGAGAVELESVPGADHTFRLIETQQELLVRTERIVVELVGSSAAEIAAG